MTYGNSLRRQADRDRQPGRVDIILTNPPFGGEEEAGIRGNFPRRQADLGNGPAVPATHHAEAAATGSGSEKAAGPGVVVPNGTLFGDGVCARIKHELLTEFNLHTIVRLPNGVFAPYTSIPTNLLFFDRSGPNEDHLVLRAAVARGAEELHEDQAHPVRGVCRLPEMVGQAEGKRPGMEGQGVGCHQEGRDGNLVSVNLDIKNPNAEEALEHCPRSNWCGHSAKEKRIIEIMGEIKAMLR